MTEPQKPQTTIALFQKHYVDLRDLVSEDPSRLLVNDIDNIVQAFASRLDEYTGDLESAPFLE